MRTRGKSKAMCELRLLLLIIFANVFQCRKIKQIFSGLEFHFNIASRREILLAITVKYISTFKIAAERVCSTLDTPHDLVLFSNRLGYNSYAS